MVFSLTLKIKNNKIENVKKFIGVKLYGAKPSIVNDPNKKGRKNITTNLLFSKVFKLNLKSFFQFYSFYNNLYFLHDQNQLNAINHEPKFYQILQENFFFYIFF